MLQGLELSGALDRRIAHRQCASSRPPGRGRRDEKYVVLHPTQDLVRNAANEYALE